MAHDHDDMLWREAAVGRVLELRREVLADRPTVSIPLDESAGRTLADPVVADRDRPPHSHATMDGFAFDATDEYPLRIVDRSVFPEDDAGSLDTGTAVRIATGAPLPEGANAVLKREEATETDGELRGTEIEPGTYVYQRGSNVAAGETLIEAGERLRAADALLLGDLGHDEVTVHAPLSVGLLATGTEIHEGRSRDLDSAMLAGLIRRWGHEATHEGSVPDDYDRVRNRIAALADDHDVVMTTGGTSVGKKDHVVRALDELGEILFHRVRIRPGKPIAVARLDDHDALAFAIPGKPVGAYVVTSFVAGPFFTGRSAFPTHEATLARDVDIAVEGFEYVVPVTFDDGEAMPLGHVDSALRVYDEVFDPSVLSSSTRASRADGVFVTRDAVEEGQSVDVIPLSALE